jgi:hypothetical protein
LPHLVRKMRPSHDGGSRIGIVLNGSPLFTGGAGSGESEMPTTSSPRSTTMPTPTWRNARSTTSISCPCCA